VTRRRDTGARAQAVSPDDVIS
jgi:CheY-like chemotaxis protein